MNKIISVFPGIGKTTLVQINKNYIDLESSDYKWIDIDKTLPIEERKGTAKTINPDFPNNYIKKINELTSMGFNVLISSHKEVREALQAQGIEYTIILPSLDMKEEMISRYLSRGNQESFVNLLKTNYEKFVGDLSIDPNEKIILKSGQYLSDLV